MSFAVNFRIVVLHIAFCTLTLKKWMPQLSRIYEGIGIYTEVPSHTNIY